MCYLLSHVQGPGVGVGIGPAGGCICGGVDCSVNCCVDSIDGGVAAVGVTVDDNDRMVVEPSMIMTEGGNNYS